MFKIEHNSSTIAAKLGTGEATAPGTTRPQSLWDSCVYSERPGQLRGFGISIAKWKGPLVNAKQYGYTVSDTIILAVTG